MEARDIDAMIGKLEPAPEDQAGAAPEPEQAPVVSDENAVAEFLGLIPIAAELAGMKRTAAIWSDDARKAIADRAVRVLVKYEAGRDILGKLRRGAYVEELALFVTGWTIVKATVETAKDEIKELREHAAEHAAKEKQEAKPDTNE